MKEQRLEELFTKYLNERLTDTEEKELFQLWLNPSLENSRVKIMENLYDGLPADKDMSGADAEMIFQQIIQSQSSESPRLMFGKRRNIWGWLTVAASILVVVGLVSYLFSSRKEIPIQQTAKADQATDRVAPETNRAMIKLGNGETIYLDSAANGSLTVQGSIKVVKLEDGKIAYEETGSPSEEKISYNTLFNPRGSRVIDITLSDGSRVWLNSGSSVTYPIVFAGNERQVSVDGEAYFEIAHDASKPFFVRKGNTEVKVLGTNFNVNAYNDEADIRVTLLQGSVQVTNSQSAAVIKPGDQAIVKLDKIAVAGNVDLEQVMSWKEGYFRMKGTDLAFLMRQIARWYDIEVVYKSKVPEARFGGIISREVSLLDVLMALEQYGIDARMENGKIVVY